MFSSSGKKQTSAAITTFDISPKPNQIRNSGAIAIFGTVWNATMYG